MLKVTSLPAIWHVRVKKWYCDSFHSYKELQLYSTYYLSNFRFAFRSRTMNIPPVKFKNEELYYPGLDAEIRYATTEFGTEGDINASSFTNPVYDELVRSLTDFCHWSL